LILPLTGIDGNVIRTLVPLVIGDAELDEALDVLETAMSAAVEQVPSGAAGGSAR
jgi:4-aminobutyrate aminotransferase-like enzyme